MQLPTGVVLTGLSMHPDERGVFTEVFRKQWETGADPVQWNVVSSGEGVLRGVHVHPKHDDYLLILSGRATVGLQDLRRGIDTYGLAATVELSGDERVLEIGTGSGYQAAILGELAREVYTIEIVEPLAERAAADLERLGYENVHVRAGDGYKGWPEEAPFDAIIVTAAPDHVPQPLIDQLAVGGRMVIPIGRGIQSLTLITRDERGVKRKTLLGVMFVPMTGEAQQK